MPSISYRTPNDEKLLHKSELNFADGKKNTQRSLGHFYRMTLRKTIVFKYMFEELEVFGHIFHFLLHYTGGI